MARYHRPPSRSAKACHTLPNDRAGERGGARHTKPNKGKVILAARKDEQHYFF
nr:MAG TPA: hypothetical protein [Caudoviricetes sp.]